MLGTAKLERFMTEKKIGKDMQTKIMSNNKIVLTMNENNT